ncbi:hypothetical protein Pmar_PMAR021340, partial [Perkinsus marinus ATCC 50983]
MVLTRQTQVAQGILMVYVKNWEDDTEDEYEQEYIASLKNEGKQKSYIGAATGGVAAAVGTFVRGRDGVSIEFV